jgi:predicted PurR-regulated permease PerM
VIDKINSHHGTRFLISAAALVIIVYGIYQAQAVVALLLLSVFLALLGTPPVLFLKRKHVPSFVAVIIIMAGMITLLLIVGGVLGVSLSTFSDALPFYQKRLHEQVLALRVFLASKSIVITEKALFEYFNPVAVVSLTAGFITAMGLVPNILLVMLTVAFILLEASSFPHKLRSILGNPELAFPQVTKFVDDIRRYMIIKTIISLIAGGIIGLWLYILGVDYPVLWGFLAFLLHYVPNMGILIASIPAVLLAFLQLGLESAALVAAGYLTVGFIFGNVVEPRLMGRKLGLSTLVVFLSLMFWGCMLGPIGVILCVPLTMSLKFAFESSKGAQWIAVLLGSEKSNESNPPVLKEEIHLERSYHQSVSKEGMHLERSQHQS